MSIDVAQQGDTFETSMMSWVMNEDDLAHLLAAIETCEEVVIDLETTGLDEHSTTNGATNGGVSARVVLASLTLPHAEDLRAGRNPSTYVVPLSHPDSPWLGQWRKVLRRIAQTVASQEVPVVNQNMKFDSKWIKATCGIDLSHLIEWDTQVGSHLLDENSSTRLKDRAPAEFGVQRWDDHDLTYPGAAEDVPMFDLGIYAARDTYWTWRLAQFQRARMFLMREEYDEPESTDEIEAARLGKLAVWCSMPTVRTLTAIEQRGIALDVEWVQSLLDDYSQTRDELFTRLSGMYPFDVDPSEASFAPTSNWFREWSEAAVRNGDLVVADLTPTGKARWSKNVLVRQARGGSQVAQDLLDLRGLIKRIEYLSSWLNSVTPQGRIHTTYNVGSVLTGRLSSSGPNMQQVTQVLKGAFVPSPGYVFVDLDYSQIELRVAAFISRCEPMIEAFRTGADLHTRLAARITGKPESEVTPTERQAGKSANFGLLYGMGPYGFRMYAEDVYGVVFTQDEAMAVHHAFFETWDGIRQWHSRSGVRLEQTGRVVSPIGRVRRLPDIWDGNEERQAGAVRGAINSPVQGFASDLMQMAAASIEGNLPGHEAVNGARIVATVHDSILIEVPAERWKELGRECQRRMLAVTDVLERLDCTFDVPLAAEGKVGTRWGLSDVGTL